MKPKFLLAFDRDFDRKFVVHTQHPICISEVKENFEEKFIDIVDVAHDSRTSEISPERLAGLMRRMGDWYRSTLKK